MTTTHDATKLAYQRVVYGHCAAGLSAGGKSGTTMRLDTTPS